jgi:hypothetical protein
MIDETLMTFACVPSCFATPPSGIPACPATITCDMYSGTCTNTTPMGAENGDSCMADGDCKGGICLAEMNADGTPSGFIGGYCLSDGLVGDMTVGQPIPTSNCPSGTGVVPVDGEFPGDSAPCFKTCTADADCRAGYHCDHFETDTMMPYFSNGACIPVNCLQTGVTCPSGYTCHTQTFGDGTMTGVCGH